MLAKILGLIFIVIFLVGCESTPEVSSSSQATNPNTPAFDNAPVTYDIFPSTVTEDTQSGWIFLSYTDADGDQATSCQISNRQNINVTTPCLCYSGLCYLKVTGFSNYTGFASFKYSITANNMTSQLSTAAFFISATSESPVAHDYAFQMSENTVYTATGTLEFPKLKGTDPDGDSLTCHKVTNPLHGVVTVNANCTFTYTPTLNYAGPDSFTFKVNDGTNDSSPALVNVTSLRQNSNPIANSATINAYQNTARTFSLTGSDPDGGTLFYNVTSQPVNGTISVSGSSVTYTPKPNFIGTDAFTFYVDDGSIHSGTATITINVQTATIYLSAAGNDATGTINDPTKPYLTAQAAVNRAILFSPSTNTPLRIIAGPGNFGNVTLTGTGIFGHSITWSGDSKTTTFIGNITLDGADGAAGVATGDPATGGYDGQAGLPGRSLILVSDFTLTFGNISSNGGDGGLHAVDLPLKRSHPGLGATGGTLQITAYVGSISTVGGAGHAGAKGGTVILNSGSTSGSIDVSGGNDLCTDAVSCITTRNSSPGGTVSVLANSIVSGNITAKGGFNYGKFGTALKTAGAGGAVTVSGRVLGDINTDGGNSYDSQVGAGGTVSTAGGSEVLGSIRSISGSSANAGSGNDAGSITAQGNVQDIYAYSHPDLGGRAGTVSVNAIANDIHVESFFVDCGAAYAGNVNVFISANVANVYAEGGNHACPIPSGGFVNVFGRVTGLINVSGGDGQDALETPGQSGKVRLNSTATVNLINAIGGNAFAGSCKAGGKGGDVDVVSGATYVMGNLDVSGGTGDTGCGRPNGVVGSVNLI